MLLALDHTLGNTGFGDGAPRGNRRGRQSQRGSGFQVLVYSLLCPQLGEEGFFQSVTPHLWVERSGLRCRKSLAKALQLGMLKRAGREGKGLAEGMQRHREREAREVEDAGDLGGNTERGMGSSESKGR